MKRTVLTMMALSLVGLPTGSAAADSGSSMSEGCAMLNQRAADAPMPNGVLSGDSGLAHFLPGETIRVEFGWVSGPSDPMSKLVLQTSGAVLKVPAVIGFEETLELTIPDGDAAAMSVSWMVRDRQRPGRGQHPAMPTAQISCFSPDGDGDGVFDDVDNCVNVPNADQKNFDWDQYGDACDDATDTAASSAHVIKDLEALNVSLQDKHVASAIEELTEALPLGTVDASTDAKVAKKVFHAYEDAVDDLGKAAKDAVKNDDPATAAALQSAIDILVEGSHRLADEAISASFVADSVTEAAEKLAKSDGSMAKGDSGDAIKHYGKAWAKAVQTD